MSKRAKWLLLTDVLALALLVSFFCDLAIALPAPPQREHWSFVWPPFGGDHFVSIPSWVRSVCFLGILVTAGVLVVYGLRAVSTKLKVTIETRRKAVR
jgi:hypothetical protein